MVFTRPSDLLPSSWIRFDIHMESFPIRREPHVEYDVYCYAVPKKSNEFRFLKKRSKKNAGNAYESRNYLARNNMSVLGGYRTVNIKHYSNHVIGIDSTDETFNWRKKPFLYYRFPDSSSIFLGKHKYEYCILIIKIMIIHGNTHNLLTPK